MAIVIEITGADADKVKADLLAKGVPEEVADAVCAKLKAVQESGLTIDEARLEALGPNDPDDDGEEDGDNDGLKAAIKNLIGEDADSVESVVDLKNALMKVLRKRIDKGTLPGPAATTAAITMFLGEVAAVASKGDIEKTVARARTAVELAIRTSYSARTERFKDWQTLANDLREITKAAGISSPALDKVAEKIAGLDKVKAGAAVAEPEPPQVVKTEEPAQAARPDYPTSASYENLLRRVRDGVHVSIGDGLRLRRKGYVNSDGGLSPTGLALIGE